MTVFGQAAVEEAPRFAQTDSELERDGSVAYARKKTAQGETEAEQDARVEREKAEWRAQETRRQVSEEVLHARLQESGRLAAQVGLPDLYQWTQERQVDRLDLDRQTEQTEAQTQMQTTTQELSRCVAEANRSGNSWEYRKAILGKARGQVASHLTELSALKARYHDKFAEFTGQDRMQGELEQKMGEVEKRRKFLEDYYGVLEQLAGNGEGAQSEMKRLGAANPELTPELVRNSSKMRLAARRRRNVWEEVA